MPFIHVCLYTERANTHIHKYADKHIFTHVYQVDMYIIYEKIKYITKYGIDIES